jgi:hypothetical protein
MGNRFLALARQITGDITRALMVLALLFLTLGQASQPSTGQVGASPAVHAALVANAALADLCGGDDQNGLGHAPCHACRTDGALLPPAPCTAQPAFAKATTIAYFGQPELVLVARDWQPAASRAPPVA